MFTPSRDEARRFLIDAWKKYAAGAALSAMEELAVGVIALHPEYHGVLERPDANVDRDYSPEQGDINPFLHLSLHIAVAEQLSIDQPRGIRQEFERLRVAKGNEHEALHAVLD